MFADTTCVAPLYTALLDELRQHPEGLGEYELIRRLEYRGDTGFEAAALRDPVELFRTHFLLFHYLYRLRGMLRQGGEDLEIHCLRIRVLPALPSCPGALGPTDPLAAYYLDLGNLEGVDAGQVHAMLAAFWRRFRLRGERARALAVLGLSEPAGPADIKRQYRRLVMRHHPDRGGDKHQLQEINEAMALLSDS